MTITMTSLRVAILIAGGAYAAVLLATMPPAAFASALSILADCGSRFVQSWLRFWVY